MEWLESEYLGETKKNYEVKIAEDRQNDLKNAIEYYLSIEPSLKERVEMLKALSTASKEDEFKTAIQTQMYGLAAEFPANIEVKQEDKKLDFKVDTNTSLKFNNTDEIVEILFGKDWIRKEESTKPLKESYQNINIGEIEVSYNPDTYECMYSVGVDDKHDKKINLTKIPSVDIPYNTETIIKNEIEKQYRSYRIHSR